jgi:phospholipase/carboxylesterase
LCGGKALSLEVISVPTRTGQPPKGLIVLLHGWGANYYDLVDLSAYLDLPDYQFLCPNAPFAHPYSPTGRMWYGFPQNSNLQDLQDLGARSDLPEGQQLSESRQLLLDWLTSLSDSTGVPLSKTVLAGFSQGGAMTLDLGTRLPLGALMVLSGYLHSPLQPGDLPIAPVLLVHGRQDGVVPLAAAHRAKDALVKLDAPLEYHELDMGHEIQPSVLKIMQSFLSKSPFYLGEFP